MRDRADLLCISCDIHCLNKPEDVLPHAAGRLQVLNTPCVQAVVPGALNAANAPYVVSTLTMAAELTGDGLYDAVVTAPVQKSIINDSGIPFSGHTEFFADFFHCDDVVMLLANQQFKVALATTHLPLRDVADAISRDSLCKQLRIISQSFSKLYGISRPKIAMLGLNPHAGEGGHLGREEIDELIPACELARSEGIDVSLPLPADTAFVSEEVKAADVVLAMYHDQGLPVLKTAGLGILSTSHLGYLLSEPRLIMERSLTCRLGRCIRGQPACRDQRSDNLQSASRLSNNIQYAIQCGSILRNHALSDALQILYVCLSRIIHIVICLVQRDLQPKIVIP